jgi:glycosyltransferase involved in cell wall biosynthesis
LVEVAKKVYEKHPDWEWHIWGAGNNDTEKTIASLIHEESLDDFLKIKGVTNDIYNKYKEYSFFVMTSRNEGFGMVIVEAQRAKLPVIAFNCECGPNELILNDKNGFLIDCFDIDKMAYKINYLIEHPEVRKTMSDNSMLDKEKLKLSLICDKWKNVIEE